MERMNHSDGPRKIQLQYGITRFGREGEAGADITALLRQNYPSYFIPQNLNIEDFYGTMGVDQAALDNLMSPVSDFPILDQAIILDLV